MSEVLVQTKPISFTHLTYYARYQFRLLANWFRCKIIIIGKVIFWIRINTFLGNQHTPGKSPYVSIVTRFHLHLSLQVRKITIDRQRIKSLCLQTISETSKVFIDSHLTVHVPILDAVWLNNYTSSVFVMLSLSVSVCTISCLEWSFYALCDGSF